jgi:NTP pyrophosphatase (non-canonical NTP hydrolase)
MNDTLQPLIAALRTFAKERDWGQFHAPKNLACALSVEAAELLEPFQWLTEEQSRNLSPAQHAAVSDEAADVFLYLLQLCDQLDIDLMAVAHAKLERNKLRFPVEAVRGSSAQNAQP